MSADNAVNNTNTEAPSPLDIETMKKWYKEQISLAKLRTELAELMSREAEAGAKRLHFLGAIANMQNQGPQAAQENAGDENDTKSEDVAAPSEDQTEAVLRSIK